MAVYNKFTQFAADVVGGKHNFSADTFKVLLTNTAPVAGNTVRANLIEIAAANGYAAGGVEVDVVVALVGLKARVTGTNFVLTATGNSVGPFRYAVFYNATHVTQPLISWWDYGTSLQLQNGDTLTVNFDAANGILDIQ